MSILFKEYLHIVSLIKQKSSSGFRFTCNSAKLLVTYRLYFGEMHINIHATKLGKRIAKLNMTDMKLSRVKDNSRIIYSLYVLYYALYIGIL